MEIAIADEVQVEEFKYPTRPGMSRLQRVLTCEAPDGLAFRLIRSRYLGGSNAFETPRHHHAFQQIRFAESGTMNFAPDQDIPQGEIAYFPRGTFYGPQRRDEGVGLTVQFGFDLEMHGGKEALDVYRHGVERLRLLGTVGNGTFTDTDPDTGEQRTRDTWEAATELTSGKKFSIPTEGYASAILMHPQAYAYYDASPGVEVKHLGAFYDHAGPNADVRISVIRISPGGEYRLSAERAQLTWTTMSGLQIDGQTYPELTCLYSPREEDVVLSAAEPVEVFLVEFPRLD
jgi:hypothetical protein